jgi:hypothetical protein
LHFNLEVAGHIAKRRIVLAAWDVATTSTWHDDVNGKRERASEITRERAKKDIDFNHFIL